MARRTGKIKHVLFDFGGTLANYVPSREALFRRAAAQQGVRCSTAAVRDAFRSVESHFGYSSLRIQSRKKKEAYYMDFSQKICDYLGISNSAAVIHRAFRSSFKRAQARWVLDPQALPLLKRLQTSRVGAAIVANWDKDLETVVDGFGIRSYVQGVFSSQAIGCEKPDPSIFRHALSELGVRDARSVLYVGDRYDLDVIGARAANIKPVLIDRAGLMPQADCVKIHSLRGLLKVLEC